MPPARTAPSTAAIVGGTAWIGSLAGKLHALDLSTGKALWTHDLWQDLSTRIYDYLNQISLQDLMNRRGVQEVVERQEGGDGTVSLGQLKAETAGA